MAEVYTVTYGADGVPTQFTTTNTRHTFVYTVHCNRDGVRYAAMTMTEGGAPNGTPKTGIMVADLLRQHHITLARTLQLWYTRAPGCHDVAYCRPLDRSGSYDIYPLKASEVPALLSKLSATHGPPDIEKSVGLYGDPIELWHFASARRLSLRRDFGSLSFRDNMYG